jgi:hydroxymethylglutaryl-CoA reductase (NADPH)
MDIHHQRVAESLRTLLRQYSPAQLFERLTPKHHAHAQKIPAGSETSGEELDARWNALHTAESARCELLDTRTQEQAPRYARHIENFVGTVKVPVGVIGPVRVNGVHAQGDYYVTVETS